MVDPLMLLMDDLYKEILKKEEIEKKKTPKLLLKL